MGTALGNYRALDLTDEKGMFCGKILASLGVDVIKVERPGGDPSRRIGPFYHNIPDPEKSLFWFFHNTDKRGITLNLETADGREIFKKLLSKVDFVIESFYPGYLDSLGLGYVDISAINPRIVMTSITPFGQTGPYRNYKFDDIVAMAMGGYMQFMGDSDRPPLRFTVPQSYLQASAHAAVSSLIALYYRDTTDKGQFVDVSIQEAVARALFQEIPYWEIDHFQVKRLGTDIFRSGVRNREAWSCKDGQVGFRILLGAYVRSFAALAELMREEGFIIELPEGVKDWEDLDMSKIGQERMSEWMRLIECYFQRHTKEELFSKALQRKIHLGPSYNVKEILEFEQLKARGFWKKLEHDELKDNLVYPGEVVKLSLTPWQVNRRAPLIGEHNIEIYNKEIGLSLEDLGLLEGAGVI